MEQEKKIFSFSINKVKSIILSTAIGLVILGIATVYMCEYFPVVLHLLKEASSVAGKLIPLHRWASKSDFPELASIYYLSVVLLLPLSVVATIVFSCYPPVGKLAESYSKKQRIAALFAAALFSVLALLLLLSINGEDTQYLKVGTSLFWLATLGWLPFAFSGVLLGMSSVMIWKSITGLGIRS